jgi:molecular chaperone GrpE (heat shock protein)
MSSSPVKKVINKLEAQSDEFAAAMQQLGAEAVKTLPFEPGFVGEEAELMENSTLSTSLTMRLENLEKTLIERLEALGAELSFKPSDFKEEFEKIEEKLAAISGSENINQQLFDSLHAELRNYRDNFLHESLQKPFIHDLVLLYDDLNSLCEQLRGASGEKNGKRSHVAQWRNNLENAIHSLVEILHRFDVREIEPKERLDRSYHRVVSYEPADFPEEDGRIVMRLRRGFVWRGKLIRPEEVIAKRYG